MTTAQKTDPERDGDVAVGIPVDRTVRRLLTPWLDGKITPRRKGWYRAQDDSFRCGCCWFMAHWDGEDWHTEGGRIIPGARQWLPRVRRWRGLAEPPNGADKRLP